jgi:hypothetical protein
MKWLAVFVIFFSFLNVGAANNNGEASYRAVIAFYSICCGPDPRDIAIVKNYIKSFEETYNVELKFDSPTDGTGPEGEWAMCFKLEELDVNAQAVFVKGIKEALSQASYNKNPNRDGNSEIVENKSCH